MSFLDKFNESNNENEGTDLNKNQYEELENQLFLLLVSFA